MKFLLTGANGYIGSHLASALLQHGHEVNALIYPGSNAGTLSSAGAHVHVGDIRDYFQVYKAAIGCDAVFHLASYVGIWAHDRSVFDDVNVKGTRVLLDVCRDLRIQRVLISSSCGIFGPSNSGEMVDEGHEVDVHRLDAYEFSKFRQVKVAMEYLKHGVEVVFVYPTRVFGPGVRSDGNSLTGIFEGVLNGSWKIMIGNGRNIGNYIYVEDVVRGMMISMNKGKSGDGYILGGYNFSYNFLFEVLQFLSGSQLRLMRVPAIVLRAAGKLLDTISSVTGRKPFLTGHAARKFTSNWIVSTSKIRKLGFRPTPLVRSLRKTLSSIRAGIQEGDLTYDPPRIRS